MSRPSENKYENCTSVSVPVDADLHREFKVLCVQNGTTIKEELYNIVMSGIQTKLGIRK